MMEKRTRRSPPDSASLYIGDLDKNVTKYELHKIFGVKGEIDEIVIPKTKEGKAGGYAYINYKRTEDVCYAPIYLI